MSRHLRFWAMLTLIIAVLCLTIPIMPTHADDTTDAYVPSEVIVKLRSSVNLPVVAATYGLLATPLDQLCSLPIYRMEILDGTSPTSNATALVNDVLNLGVVYAEPNYIGQAPEARRQSSWSVGGDSGTYVAQWAPNVLRLAQAQTVSRGAGVTVAVLDTGADLDHPALAGKLVQGFDFVDLDNDPSEEGVYGQDIAYGHGTHVAGLVALVAPDAKIQPIRILKPDGTGTSWALAEGIRYAVSSHVGVVNLSYTFRLPAPSKLIDDILAALTAPTDPVIVAAAGNSGPSTSREYPAGEGLPNILAVAASTENDTLADFSTRGSWVSVVAPGVNILSSVPEEIYATWSGTSMATPLTAGTAALVRAAYPSLSPAAVANQIKATAATITGPVPRRVDSAAALGISN